MWFAVAVTVAVVEKGSPLMLSRTKAILVGAAHTAELPQCRLAASDLFTQPRFLTRPQLLTRL
jgi:hypothetical protein